MAVMKGVSPLVSYVLAVLLATVVVTAVVLLVNAFYSIIIQDEIRRELTQVAAQTSSKITEIYSISKVSKASPANSTAVLLAESELNLPSQVVSRNYKVTLLSATQVTSILINLTVSGQNTTSASESQTGKVVAETTEDPIISVEYDVPSIDVDIQGRSENPSNTTLRYYRYNPNGTITDAILIGGYTLVGQVTVVS